MTQDMLEKYPMWFCYAIYDYSGAPKLERALMDFAKENFRFALFDEDAIGHDCVERLQARADRLLKENPRWKPVTVRLIKNDLVDGHWTVHFGNMILKLQKVNHYYE